MKLDILPRDKVSCVQVQAQMREAARMNRVRLIHLIEAWRFILGHYLHPSREENIKNRFEQWREKQHSKLFESTIISIEPYSWIIRLENGQRVQVFGTDEKERETSWDAEAIEIRDSIIELWRRIRMAQLTGFDTEASALPSDEQYDRIYSGYGS
jgi:hypothetical protein